MESRENNEKVLEEVCDLFSKMKMDDVELKFRLSKGLESVINRYAKTMEDVNRLKEVINMPKVSKETRQIIRDVYKEEIDKAREEEKAKAKEERLNLARKFAEKLNIDEVAEISGLSKEQILNPQPK